MLSGIAGVEEAYIYGSWAARYLGEPGPVPHDVDVLIIGTADENNLYDIAREAEHRLGREVNISAVSPQYWEAPTRLTRSCGMSGNAPRQAGAITMRWNQGRATIDKLIADRGTAASPA